jgi:hypothetical protein
MTRDQLIETMARAICAAEGFDPDNQETTGISYWVTWAQHATAALTALEAAGMRVVPVEPTKAMLSVSYNDTETLDDTWRAMVLAAQEDSTSE